MSLHEGKVAFITGVARGQGRAHAVKLAQQGMNIIGVDICETIDSMDYPAANEADLAETVRLVEAEDRQIIAHKADVRDAAALEKAVAEGVSQFGRLDVIIANAGFIRLTEGPDPAAVWRDVTDVLLNGVWNTVQAGLPTMLDGGRGGSVVITSSTAGLKGVGKRDAGTQAYAAAKRGVVGLMQVLAKEYAQDWIRVNTIHPTGVYTGMTMNETFRKLFEDAGSMLQGMQNALPVEMLEPTDIANVVSWLVSDEAKYLTGVQLPIDAGMMIR
ncbi:mycofactocin-coupled SDR family oxidoreductase [Rhodococcus erythropolis]|uniref:mycofactocin-coupled SDR family oxidoreductase n=1 Tax=Rhodococcus erythropolis TaxID=1833 RepID=UPI0024B6F8B4|nr:mycofactocin-coupled SDR family oxidoreductase [Rhodococcus erythropolis]MDJ0011441.1 mycofactocin-coupled SDR family oxidoreductase [Rhodococcus erythropolis]